MSYVDSQLLLSDAQAVTTDAASTNIIDLGVAGRNIGAGEPLAVVVTVDVAADHTTGDEAYAVEVQVDDDSAFGSTTIITSYTIPQTTVKGDVHVIPIPITSTNSDNRYLRVNYNTGGTTPTITVTTFLTALSAAPQKYVPYAKGYTIS